MDDKDYLEEVEVEETKEQKDEDDKGNDYEDVCFLWHLRPLPPVLTGVSEVGPLL